MRAINSVLANIKKEKEINFYKTFNDENN